MHMTLLKRTLCVMVPGWAVSGSSGFTIAHSDQKQWITGAKAPCSWSQLSLAMQSRKGMDESRHEVKVQLELLR